jgi:hypothetical protein
MIIASPLRVAVSPPTADLAVCRRLRVGNGTAMNCVFETFANGTVVGCIVKNAIGLDREAFRGRDYVNVLRISALSVRKQCGVVR